MGENKTLYAAPKPDIVTMCIITCLKSNGKSMVKKLNINDNNHIPKEDITNINVNAINQSIT
jgi:hypothetical protein